MKAGEKYNPLILCSLIIWKRLSLHRLTQESWILSCVQKDHTFLFLLPHYLPCSPCLSLPFSHILTSSLKMHILAHWRLISQSPISLKCCSSSHSFFISVIIQSLQAFLFTFMYSSAASLLSVLGIVASCSGIMTEFGPQTGAYQHVRNLRIYQSQANLCQQRIFKLIGT